MGDSQEQVETCSFLIQSYDTISPCQIISLFLLYRNSMNKIRVAINGFGRIGRAFVKVARQNPDIEIVAVNDLGNIKNFAYLLKYDTAYGVSPFEVSVKESSLVIDGHEVAFSLRFT